MDPQYGLLEILMQVELITESERLDVLDRSGSQAGKNYLKQNDALIACLIQCINCERKYSDYLESLRATSQPHVENYMSHDGSKYNARF